MLPPAASETSIAAWHAPAKSFGPADSTRGAPPPPPKTPIYAVHSGFAAAAGAIPHHLDDSVSAWSVHQHVPMYSATSMLLLAARQLNSPAQISCAVQMVIAAGHAGWKRHVPALVHSACLSASYTGFRQMFGLDKDCPIPCGW